ncbi:exodeoxyribonuclease VII large subunit [Wohlfahrtiimonas chitiniclastica]|uniref:exodeoxyribonuclease VII large subunit n=1 Tax=Wohlfahrtiimonas chitiniclastica TaxID=400946 RepID=UPI001FEF7255|nr:exodeoxyribonuclease VII large subunit [Wohlfahrtiimonas chitiniclastica]
MGSIKAGASMMTLQSVTVSILNQQIKQQLESGFFQCLVTGEVSNVTRAQSGHIYFNLKDDGGMIRCVIWRSQAGIFGHLIDNGAALEIHGKVTVYVPRGEYQLVANRITLAGQGDLAAAYEALKMRLSAEGLFDAQYKKSVPQHPKAIGIITSENAAALQDVLKVLKEHRRDIPYVIYPTLVQGDLAAPKIAAAIERANREGVCDVLLVVRGGGSIEDLWCFNEEIVVRAAFASKIPIISGVGHEIDTTLIDYVADLRAPTPTAAAKFAAISKMEVVQQLDHLAHRLERVMAGRVALANKAVDTLQMRLNYLHPMRQITEKRTALMHLSQRLNAQLIWQPFKRHSETLARLDQRLTKSMDDLFKAYQARLQKNARMLDNLSPLKVLGRGYSITEVNGRAIEDVNAASMGDLLVTRLANGEIHSEVKAIVPKN